MRTRIGIIPDGDNWEMVRFFPEWILWRKKEITEGTGLIKLTARQPRKGKANITLGWDYRMGRIFSFGIATRKCKTQLKEYFPELYAELYDVMNEMFPPDAFDEIRKQMKDVRSPSEHLGTEPEGNGWELVPSFGFPGWSLWAKEGRDGWYNLKLVALVPQRKANYRFGWNIVEKRFSRSYDVQELEWHPDLHGYLLGFLTEEES